MEHSPERHRQFTEKTQEAGQLLAMGDPAVQRALILMLDPDRHHAVEVWTTANENGDSYAKRFREYVDAPERTDAIVDLSNEVQLTQIFSDVTNPTIH